jgi:hypothetical protein
VAQEAQVRLDAARQMLRRNRYDVLGTVLQRGISSRSKGSQASDGKLDSWGLFGDDEQVSLDWPSD